MEHPRATTRYISTTPRYVSPIVVVVINGILSQFFRRRRRRCRIRRLSSAPIKIVVAEFGIEIVVVAVLFTKRRKRGDLFTYAGCWIRSKSSTSLSNSSAIFLRRKRSSLPNSASKSSLSFCSRNRRNLDALFRVLNSIVVFDIVIEFVGYLFHRGRSSLPNSVSKST
jgi:hypothetical protein